MKNLKALGKILIKSEQKMINGGHASCNIHCNSLGQPDSILCACDCHPDPTVCK